MIIKNSSQPFLYQNNNKELGLLYCYADHSVDLFFGDSFIIQPWKINNKNLITGHNEIVPTNTFDEQLGRVVMECNPSIDVIDNKLTIFWTAGFSNGKNTPISYYYCAMDSEDYTFTSLSNFRILHKAYSCVYLDGSLIYKEETVNPEEPLIIKNLATDTSSVLTIEDFDLLDISRINRIFNQNKLIITGKNPENIDCSYIVNSSGTIEKRIKNLYNYDVYKASVFDNNLAYAVTIDNHKSIVIENIG
jgi:hypothetical protein